MTLPIDSAESPRHAALLLHAMEEGDRAWLLASLTAAHRTRLELLLQELQDLGIPPDPALLQPVLEAPVTRRQAAPADRLQHLSHAEQSTLAKALEAEPPQLGALLQRVRTGTERPALTAALCEAAVSCLDQAAKRSREEPRGAARWRRLWRAAVFPGERT